MGLAGGHAGLLSSVLLAPGGRFHPTGHDVGFLRWATTWASRRGHCADMNGAPLTRTPPRRSWGRGPPPPGWRRIQARRLTCLTASCAAPTGRVPGLRGAFIIASTPSLLCWFRGPTSRYCCAVECLDSVAFLTYYLLKLTTVPPGRWLLSGPRCRYQLTRSLVSSWKTSPGARPHEVPWLRPPTRARSLRCSGGPGWSTCCLDSLRRT